MIALLLLSALGVAGASWSTTAAESAAWFSAAAYCDRSTYQTRTWTGPTAGFIATKTIYDRRTDTNGYIGYHPNSNTIYVVFRGTSSVRNWIIDLEIAKADEVYPACSGCLVHSGFYKASEAVWPAVLAGVDALRATHSNAKVMVTGHSLGAALATLTAIDLVAAGFDKVALYHFGSPRIGNARFSLFASQVFDTIFRVVHDNDIVPHVPFESMDFRHTCTEYFEDKGGAVKKCADGCEDNSCGEQYRFIQTSVDAHLWYLGMPISSCEYVSTPAEALAFRIAHLNDTSVD